MLSEKLLQHSILNKGACTCSTSTPGRQPHIHTHTHTHTHRARERSLSLHGADVRSLHHKKLVATSRVVSAACVSTCVLRHVVLDAAATVTDVEGAGSMPHHGMVGGCAGQGPDIAAAAAVFGNLELEALSHVLHNLKVAVLRA